MSDDLPDDLARAFAAGGRAGALMRDLDWSRSPLGSPASWPLRLRSAVGTALESPFPMLVWWGDDLAMLYNDAYSELIGDKHPGAVGRAGREAFPEIWHIIGPRLDVVLAGQGGTRYDDELILLDRHGFLEEAYFTFAFSPIREDDGSVTGIFTAVSEVTGAIIGRRRLNLLRALATSSAEQRSVEGVLRVSGRLLDAARADVPFSLLYLQGDDGRPRLVTGSGGSLPDLAAAVGPRVADLLAGPLPPGCEVSGLGLQLGDLTCDRAVVLPLEASGIAGAIVLGLSPQLPDDEEYHHFRSLAATQVSAALGDAVAYQAERARAEALAELDAAKTAFFSNVSHEFRTPLTLMLGPLEEALTDQAEPLGPGQRARVELVSRNAVRLLSLVNTLLDFSRLESGRAQLWFEPVDLGARTSGLAALFASAAIQAGLELTVDSPRLEEPVFVDTELWDKAVLNLLSNALKYTMEGHISVRLRHEGDAAVLTVTDSGVGIDPEHHERLFERFYQAPAAASRSHEGSGIGLALVAEAARVHGGSVAVDSTPGKGSTFTLRLPLGRDHLPGERVRGDAAVELDTDSLESRSRAVVADALQHAQADTGAVAVRATVSPEGSPRPLVLVVDDNRDMRAYLAGLLQTDHDVLQAPDGAAGWELLAREPVDLVVADVMMPRLDGIQLLQRIRADPRLADLPVIVLSARAGEEAAVEGLAAGASDYVLKPFSARELRARIAAALELERVRRRLAEQTAATSKANAEAAEREHALAAELQRSLLPELVFAPESLEVSVCYRPGDEGATVGGDWYDVVDLGAGRTGLVMGDVMGRGVRAAAVMGQLRAAVRAYARLDLPPSDVLELLDGVVRDLGDEHIVTCIYGVHDPHDATLTFANAGHPPPLVLVDGSASLLRGASAPPLGSNKGPVRDQRVDLRPGTVVALYTDGLVESRDRDIDEGITRLGEALAADSGDYPGAAQRVVDQVMRQRGDDDVALLLARALAPAEGPASAVTFAVEAGVDAVHDARTFAEEALLAWDVPATPRSDIVLVVSELVTNSLLYGRPPVQLRLRHRRQGVVLEVHDGAAVMPTLMRPTSEDEHGRGLQLVSRLAERWGARPTAGGKAVWCTFDLTPRR